MTNISLCVYILVAIVCGILIGAIGLSVFIVKFNIQPQQIYDYFIEDLEEEELV